MTKDDILRFAARHVLAVEASVTAAGTPQAAVIGVVVSERFELFFDTLSSSRKAQNLRRSPAIALVLGWDLDEACTLQLEGHADEPQGADLERLKALYFARFPDGLARERLPGTIYFRVRPRWLKFSDFRTAEPQIVELTGAALA